MNAAVLVLGALALSPSQAGGTLRLAIRRAPF